MSIRRVEYLLYNHDYAGAAILIHNLLEQSPQDDYLWYLLAEASLPINPMMAESALVEHLRLNPASLHAHQLKARLNELRLNASAQPSAAAELDDTRPTPLVTVVPAQTVVSQRVPDHVAAYSEYLDKLDAALETQDYAAALQFANSAIDVAGTVVERLNAYLMRGNVHQESGNTELALEDYRYIAANTDQRHIRCYVHEEMAVLHNLAEEYDQALEHFSLALEYTDEQYERARLHMERGSTYGMLDRVQESLDDLTRSIELDPAKLYYSLRSIIFFKLGLLKQALEDVNTAFNIPEGNTVLPLDDMYVYRARLHLKLGDQHQAKADCHHALKLNPQNSDAQFMLSQGQRPAPTLDELLDEEVQATQQRLKDADEAAVKAWIEGKPAVPTPVSNTAQSQSADKTTDSQRDYIEVSANKALGKVVYKKTWFGLVEQNNDDNAWHNIDRIGHRKAYYGVFGNLTRIGELRVHYDLLGRIHRIGTWKVKRGLLGRINNVGEMKVYYRSALLGSNNARIDRIG